MGSTQIDGREFSLAIVVPCYNEEAALPETISVLLTLVQQLIAKRKIDVDSKIILIDDGSADTTWKIIDDAAKAQAHITGIKLSKNEGHQQALYAGLQHTEEDMVVTIDADLQDGADNIEAMVDKFHQGFDIVFGVRNNRDSDSLFKKITAQSYYRMMKWIGVDLVYNHADFRLLSRRTVDALLDYPESNLFLRALVYQLGYPSAIVEYKRLPRKVGETKYSLTKMLALAWQGITSFSVVPLRFITVFGALCSVISMLLVLWVLFVKLFTNDAVPGWASTLVPLLFIGSVQLLCTGVIGEYLSKVYIEVKRRPKYHIETLVEEEKKS